MSEFPEIPGYKIEKELGKGGMGVVYLALQTSLDRQVALKVTLPSLSDMDESFTMRFVIEAKATAALNHPNIITIFDAGVHEKSSYMAMEYIASGTLKDIKKDELTHEQIAQLFIGIARGLSSAHTSGFVHRDIKPDNILIDDKGQPVLTDFGIVKTLNQNTALTVLGSTVGTPQYMSPEQIRAKELDGRSDLYSLGIMLFNILEGDVPFDDDTPSAIYIKHVTTSPPSLTHVNKVFQPIITKLLEKRPEDRYEDAKELIIALKEVIRRLKNPQLAAATKKVEIVKEKPKKTVSKKQKAIKTQITNETVVNTDLDVESLKKKPVLQAQIPKTNSGLMKNTKALAGIAAGAFLLISVAAYMLFSDDSTVDKPVMVEESQQISNNETVNNAENENTQDLVVNSNITNPNEETSTNEQDQVNQEEKRGSLDVLIDEIKKQKSDEEQAVLTESSIENEIAENANQGDENPIEESQTTSVENESITATNTTTAPELTDAALAEKQDITLINTPVEVEKTEIIKEEVAKIETQTQTPVVETTNQEELDNAVIRDILSRAQTDLNNFKLLNPANNNAYQKFTEVLRLDQNNLQGKKGMLEIAYKYIVLANKKVATNNYKEALKYIANATKIRKDYLEKGYDKMELFDLSKEIMLPNLQAMKKSVTLAQTQYLAQQEIKRQEQLKQQELQRQEQIRLAQEAQKPSYIDDYRSGVKAYKAKDYTTAEQFFRKSALQGYAQAQDKLGSLYFKGLGVKKDLKQASKWYLKSANQGYVVAQDHVGLIYLKGFGTRKNIKKAFNWFQLAAEQGYADSQWTLGLMYEKGRGVAKNRNKAISWFKKAAKQGQKLAIQKLQKLHVSW